MSGFVAKETFPATKPGTPGGAGRKASIYRTAKSSVVLRSVSLTCTLVQVPLVMPYLGAELFGFWMLLVAIGGFFGLSDFGISSAFQNDVTAAGARGETARLRPMFLTAQATMFSLAMVAALIMTAAAVTVGKATFFRSLSSELAGQAGLYTLIYVVVGACNVPLALSGKLAFGLHRGYLANLGLVAGQVFTLAALALAAWGRWPFPLFLLAATLPSLACNLALTLWLYGTLERSGSGVLDRVSYAKHTLVSGVPFLALNASLPCFFAVGPLVLSAALGPVPVAAYSLLTRALGILHNLQSGLLGALWPALTEALARKDYVWARRSIRRSVLYSIGLFCLPTLLFPWMGPQLLSLWSRLPVESFPAWMTWPLTLLFAAIFFQGPFYVALNAAGSVTLLAASFFAAAVATLGMAAWFRQSPELVPVCLAVAFGVFGLVPPIIQTMRVYRPKSAA